MTPRAPARPNGFDTFANGSAYRPGRSAPASTSRAIPTSTLTSAGRQRRDGSRPSGKRRSERPSSPAVASPIRVLNTAAAVAPGKRWVACRPTSAYCQLSSWTLLARPVSRKIQPILFSGTRRATSAPTEANVMASTRNETPPTPEKMSLGSTRPGPIASKMSVASAITTHKAQMSVATRRAVSRPRRAAACADASSSTPPLSPPPRALTSALVLPRKYALALRHVKRCRR